MIYTDWIDFVACNFGNGKLPTGWFWPKNQLISNNVKQVFYVIKIIAKVRAKANSLNHKHFFPKQELRFGDIMTERNKILVDKFCWQGIKKESSLSNVVSLSRQKTTGESFVLQKNKKKKCLDFFKLKNHTFFKALPP